MKITRSVLLFLLPALGWAGAEWVTLNPPSSVSFSVSMPPAAQKKEDQNEWRAADPAGNIYTVGYGYYTEPKKITDPEAFMRMMVGRMASNMKSKIAYLTFFKYQYVPACEFKVVDLANHRVAVGRYFLVNQWFYFLDLTAWNKDFNVVTAKKFLESFRIINPQLKDFEPAS